MPARDLAARLFGGVPRALERASAAAQPDSEGPPGKMPFWGDGGVDGRHVLAAWPDRVIRLARASDRASLESALREPCRRPAPSAPLVVVGLAYDAGRALEAIGPGPTDDLGLPEVVIARYPGSLSARSERGPWSAVGAADELLASLADDAAPNAGPDPEPAVAPAASPDRAHGAGRDAQPRLWMRDPVERERYRAGIAHVLERIAAGDLYQANIARRLEAPLPARDVPPLYDALRTAQPNRFGALWALDAERWIASNSPECLLRWHAATRTARSYPIKGTRPRGACEDADRAQLDDLLASEKDRAEHVMIVDLVRNDLGRVARTGSVRVEALFDAMTLTTVHHLVSTVACEVRPDKDLVDLLLALFPGGSITGAPKIAAMQLIDRVEPFRRSFYCGTIGIVMGGAEASFSILIRTLLAAAGRIVYATGGGIVADSDPELEWAETETKARALVLALQQDTPR
ncbi:MAG: anthranilate synthase component I family protein [Myxococcota bacterium]